tara:strand:- start:4794 stop:5006 length:213 start_codon:yes stop_codon:yes gene_type:complete
MSQQTAMQIMYNELIAYEYTIPITLIVKCKELIDTEKEQLKDAYWNGTIDISKEDALTEAEDFYNSYYNI